MTPAFSGPFPPSGWRGGAGVAVGEGPVPVEVLERAEMAGLGGAHRGGEGDLGVGDAAAGRLGLDAAGEQRAAPLADDGQPGQARSRRKASGTTCPQVVRPIEGTTMWRLRAGRSVGSK